MKLREDLNNLVKKYQSGGLKRLLDEENISDSNSTINYTKLRNIDPKKDIKNKTDRIENVQKKNNVSRKKALEIIQKEEFDKNVSRNPQSVGEISIPEDQSTVSKTWEVLTNPVTAASYWLNDQRIPDNFSKGERNNLDIATDLFNPFGIVDSAKNAVKETISLPKNLYNGEYGEAGSNFLNAGLNTLSVIPAARELKGIKELKGANAPISKLYNKIATGESALPIAWKSPIKNMTQEKSFNLFNQIKQSHDFTDAEKVLLAEYQFDSVPFTGRYENRFSPEKREALQKMIEKSKIEFPDDIVLSRRFNVQNSEVNGFKNSKHFEIGDRPSSFSSGIGAKDIADSPDRLIISGRNAKKIQDNFLKSIYEPLPEEVVDNIENYTDLKKAGFTGKPETYTTASGTENTIYPINDGFVRTFHNSTKEEKELIGSGFNLKKIGRVKNELGGHDYIMKPIEIPKKREGGVIKDNNGYRKSLDNLVEKRQSGGITDIEKNTAKDKVNQSKQFMLEYINSPKYLERLRKEYPDADEETIKRVYEDRKANFKNSSDNLSIVKKIDNEADSVLGVQYSRENDYRVDPKYQYKIHDKKAGKIEITEKGLKANPHVVTHEISHGITDGTSKMPTKTIIDIIKRTRGNKPEGFDPEGYARKFSDGFFKNEEKLLDSLISIDNDIETHSKKSDAISKANEYFENLDNYSPFSTAEVNTQFNNILYDINGVDGYSKRPTVTDYTSDPTEYLARMQSLRQELKNQGIYDASKEDFTEDHFNKFEKFILDTGPALLREQYPDLYEFINATKGSNSFKQPSYKKDIDEDIKKGSDTFKENMIWMMNNVAKNTQKNNNIVYSKKGGEIRNSLNNLSKKFF